MSNQVENVLFGLGFIAVGFLILIDVKNAKPFKTLHYYNIQGYGIGIIAICAGIFILIRELIHNLK